LLSAFDTVVENIRYIPFVGGHGQGFGGIGFDRVFTVFRNQNENSIIVPQFPEYLLGTVMGERGNKHKVVLFTLNFTDKIRLCFR
jgi:hypothetical protein